jgi:hypothetical protein
MKKLLLILALTFFYSGLSKATHIVGGGFSYEHLSGNQYKFKLTLYFDFINGSVGAKDQFALCHIFRKFDNFYMDSLYLPLEDSSVFLSYTNPGCDAVTNLKTQVLTYSAVYTMSNERFNSSKGYYMIWERCCRNNIISNIFSPESTGQTFYMEFPPVFRSGQSYINNSPKFGPVTADFPCVNQDFTLSYQATDADGDVLVYSLTNPLKGNSSTMIPRGIPPIPAPYDPVDWIPGYGATFPIPGNPGLSVNPNTGLLSCKATFSGLYVFSVKCEEFRGGVKIGEVRREMQVPVVDCPPNDPPVIILNNPQGIRLGQDDTLYLETREEDFCTPLKLTDVQRNTNIRFGLTVLNGPTNLTDSSAYYLGLNSDSASAKFCLPSCTFTPPGQFWKIRLVATDDGCPEAFSDTLQIYLSIAKSPLKAPEISLESAQPDTIKFSQNENFSLPVRAFQEQQTKIELKSRMILASGQVLNSWPGITLPSGVGKGEIKKNILFSGLCQIPGNGIIRVETIVTASRCQDTLRDTISQWFKLSPDLPDFQISSSWNGGDSITLGERSEVSFTITAEISDGSLIYLLPQGALTFEPGYRYTGPTSGFGKITGEFSYFAACEGKSGVYDIGFFARAQVCDSVYLKSLQYKVDLRYAEDNIGNPPNLITCNADEKNDYFSLENVTAGNSCVDEFDYVEIFNRWGNRVFQESTRDFRWNPVDFSEGLYYYCLHFKRRKPINGWLRLVKNK